jgi:hypothetical protein
LQQVVPVAQQLEAQGWYSGEAQHAAGSPLFAGKQVSSGPQQTAPSQHVSSSRQHAGVPQRLSDEQQNVAPGTSLKQVPSGQQILPKQQCEPFRQHVPSQQSRDLSQQCRPHRFLFPPHLSFLLLWW